METLIWPDCARPWRLREIDSSERYKALAQEYVTAIHENASALVIAPTHSECRKVTAEIRVQLKEAGLLKKARDFDTLRRVDLTEAERADSRNFKRGWVVEMVKFTPHHRPGDRYIIHDVRSGENPAILVQYEKGQHVFPMDVRLWAGSFQVYEPDKIELAVGEKIRVTKNARFDRHQVYNGGIHNIDGFTSGGEVVLDNGAVLPPDFKHLDFGYTTTSYSSQGRTVQRVFIAESSESYVAGSIEQFYVSVSRGRQLCRVYTDSVEALLDAVAASSQRTSAMELVREKDRAEDVRKAQIQASTTSIPDAQTPRIAEGGLNKWSIAFGV